MDFYRNRVEIKTSYRLKSNHPKQDKIKIIKFIWKKNKRPKIIKTTLQWSLRIVTMEDLLQ